MYSIGKEFKIHLLVYNKLKEYSLVINLMSDTLGDDRMVFNMKEIEDYCNETFPNVSWEKRIQGNPSLEKICSEIHYDLDMAIREAVNKENIKRQVMLEVMLSNDNLTTSFTLA